MKRLVAAVATTLVLVSPTSSVTAEPQGDLPARVAELEGQVEALWEDVYYTQQQLWSARLVAYRADRVSLVAGRQVNRLTRWACRQDTAPGWIACKSRVSLR